MAHVSRKLLPPNSLTGKSLGLSVSESPDLGQLGLFENHFKLALGEISRCILFAGGNIYYGGHLRKDGYTQFLIDELQRYGNRNKPFKVCLALTEHQNMSAEEIENQRESIGLFGEIIFLDLNGKPTRFSANLNPHSYKPSREILARSLTGLRTFLINSTDARVVLGGKRNGFLGRYPGIIEEIIGSIQSGKPLYLAGGFGGATLDAIYALTPENASWFTRYSPDGTDHQKLVDSLLALREAAKGQKDWSDNGLSKEENSLLAATYRPSEIAALVGHGLGCL